VPAQLGDRFSQPLDQCVEDGAAVAQVRLTAQRVEETRHVPGLGDVGWRADADETTEGRVAVQLIQTVLDVEVSAEDANKQDAPQDAEGEVVAAVASGGS
jgi:hypothetical protein